MKNFTGSILSADYSKDNEVVAVIGQAWEHRAAYKYILERQWFQAIAWYLGLQNMIWSDAVKRLAESEAPSWRVRIIVNHIQAMTRVMAAKLYKASPEWDVMPASSEAQDLQRAFIANQLLTFNYDRMLLDEKMMELLLWTLVNGNGFIQHVWNPDAGEQMFIPTEEGDTFDIESIPDAMGETECNVVSGFEMLVDPRATKFRDAAWCIYSRVVDTQDIVDAYPRADIKPEDSSYSFEFMRFKEHIKTLTNRGFQGLRGQSFGSMDSNTTLVHELWVKPRRNSRNLKRGRFVVMANGRILKNVPFPYMHGELPFTHFIEIDVPGRLWGTSTLEQLMPIQANYNRTRSQLVEIRNTMGRPKWLVPKGSGISQASITDRPGEQISYNPGFKPEQVEAPQAPAYVQNMLATDKQDMEDLSGIHEVSRAQAPGQIRSGRGVLALVEQDETRLNLVVRHFEQQMARIGRQNLSICAQFVTEKRLIRIVGADDELLVRSYRGSDLVGGSYGLSGLSYFDVKVKTVAGMPHSRAAQQDLLSTLIQDKVLEPQNPKEKRMILRMLSIGSVQNSIDNARVHRSRQLMEIEQIISGIPTPPLQWHGHEVHLEVLDDFRNSARYDTLPDEVKLAFEKHAQGHKEWIAYNAVEPEILTRKAAVVAMITENMNTVIQTAQATQSQVPGMLMPGQGAQGAQGESNGQQGQQGIRGVPDGGESQSPGGESGSEGG